MARPVEFDRVEARMRALRLFWRKGYQAASLAELLRAMDIRRSSFYAAYGDKRALFLECLDVFADAALRSLDAGARGVAPLEGIRRFFDRDLGARPDAEPQWGCLLVNTCLEMAGEDEGLRDRASAHLRRVEAAFEARLLDSGCPPPQAADLAAYLMLMLEGVRVSSRRGLPVERRRSQIQTAFRALDATLAASPA